MKQLRNRKGMTLVEIIVVLLIMSILLVIMGSLILNAFNYFNKTTDQDLNKRSLDAISEYVRSELLYATDVRVQENVPDENEWNSLYIVDGQLYKNDEPVYSESFYNYNQLVLKVRGFDKYRLDLKYAYYNADEEKVYATMDTLELLNLKLKIEKDDEFNPFANISSVTTLSKQMKIYYQKDVEVSEPEKPTDPDKGTIADQIECLNFHNNRMDYNSSFGGNGKVNYRKGDMVFYEGNWWQACVNIPINESVAPGCDRHLWKKIAGEFDETSCYIKGDVIYIYDNDGNILYFKCKQDCINYRITPRPDPSKPNDNWANFFIQCEQPEKQTIMCLPDTLAYKEGNEQSVVYKILDYLKNNHTLEDIPVFGEDDINNHKKGSFVKVFDSEKGIYRYFLKLTNGEEGKNHPGEAPGNNGKLIWQEMKIDWDQFSGYEENDIIYDKNNGYMKAKEDQTDYDSNSNNINTDIWEKLNKFK